MTILNISFDQDTVGLQFFDYYFSYKQHQESQKNYRSRIELKFNQTPRPDFINIAIVDFQNIDGLLDTSKFDLMLIDNSGESLEVASDQVRNCLAHDPKIFFLCGSFVSGQHKFFHKLIPYNHNLQLFSDCVSRPFYPQHYDLKSIADKPRSPMCFINGKNRTWRQYFLTQLQSSSILDMPIRNTIAGQCSKLLDCAFESPEDSQFRTYVNDCIENRDDDQTRKMNYYARSIWIGADGKFGKIAPGYFLIDEYLSHHCIIYPESSWINAHLFLTEKTWKCFVSRTIPWPISGSHLHAMMNKFGFMTATNLLPSHLQAFDSISDHKTRYARTVEAIEWAHRHPEIWTSSEADKIRENNFNRFWINDINLTGVEKFDQIVRNCGA